MFLSDFLKNSEQDEALKSVVLTISKGVKKISKNIDTCNLGKTESGKENASGDEQMALDILSNKLLEEELKKNININSYASEEEEDSVKLNDEGEYCIAFDPLDGSSLIDTNLTIGSIFGVYKDKSFIGQKGKNQKMAAYAVYGPRTTFFLSFGTDVYGFSLNNENEFILTHKKIKINEDTKIFSPGNLRACHENEKYLKLVNDWIIEQKTLRYSGGMVPDINSIFCKTQGIFSYPSHSKYPNGKLRILYECAPLAFLVKAGGGLALDQNGRDILDIEIEELHQRSTIFIGSRNEVIRAVEELNKKV